MTDRKVETFQTVHGEANTQVGNDNHMGVKYAPMSLAEIAQGMAQSFNAVAASVNRDVEVDVNAPLDCNHLTEDELRVVVKDGLRALLKLAGDDPDREGVIDTPDRFVKAFLEMTGGLHVQPRSLLNKNFNLNDDLRDHGDGFDIVQYDQIILSRDIPFVSLCEHHLLTFKGHAHVAYIPQIDGRVVGLSKLARLVDAYARRPQVQERLTAQIARDIDQVLNPRGVAVIIKAQHSCQCNRGIKKDGYMVTSSLTGFFKEDPKSREELYQLIQM